MKAATLAAVMGLAATLVAMGALAVGGAGITALDWWVHDTWLRAREPSPASSALVIVVRDPASDARFGTGAWDRTVLARLITSLSRAGAGVIGVDAPLGRPASPGRGGASSDALLSQAIALAGNVVLPIALEPAAGREPSGRGVAGVAPQAPPGHPSWPALSAGSREFLEARPISGSPPGLAQYAKSVGHTLAPPDPDGVVRRVPLFVRVGDRSVPAFGLALAAAFTNVDPDQIPADRYARVLVHAAGPERRRGLNVVPLADVWTAIEEGPAETLQRLVAERIVLLLLEPAQDKDRMGIQANLLDTVMTRAWLREAPPAWTLAGAVVLSGLAAWLWLALRW